MVPRRRPWRIRDYPESDLVGIRVGSGFFPMAPGPAAAEAVVMTTDRPLAYTPAPLGRPRSGRMIAGVALGVADYLGVDPTVVRIAFVVLALIGGAGIPLYIAGWLLMPEPDAPSIAADWLRGDRFAPPTAEEENR